MQKKVYIQPELRKHGSVEQLTLGSQEGGSDGGNSRMMRLDNGGGS